MIMANSSPYNGFQFDDDYDIGCAFPAKDDEPEDLITLFNMIGEKSRGDRSEIWLDNTSSRIIPFCESTSYGANQLSETPNGLFTFPSLHYPEPSTSRTFYSSDLSVTEIQSFKSGYENPKFHQDVFGAHVNPRLATYGGTQDFKYIQHALKETYIERAKINDAFGFTNDHQLMSNHGITDGVYDDSVGMSCESPEHPDNMEAQFLDLNMYPDTLYDTDATLSDNNINSVMNYETLSQRPCDIKPDITGESFAKESTSGLHGIHRFNKKKRTQVVCVKKEKHDVKPKPLKKMRKNAKVKKNDEKSADQAPLQVQNLPLQKSDISIQEDGGLAVPLKHQRMILSWSWMKKIETKSTLFDNNNSVVNNETVSERPCDIGTYTTAEGSYNNTCLINGETSVKESTSGLDGIHRCNKKKRTQVVCVKKEKHDIKTKPLKKMRKNAKVIKNDEKSVDQAPLQVQNVPVQKSDISIEDGGLTVPLLKDQVQNIPVQKSDISLQNGGLTVPLLKHQRIALSWMTKKETKSTNCCGGILADDQGLGKTISAIALILKERSHASSTVNSTKPKKKQTETLNLDEEEEVVISDTNNRTSSLKAGTLVVCPTSVLRQWNQELQNKVSTESNLSVLVYYGRFRTKNPIEVAKYDVVLTTYAIVSMEVPQQPLVEKDDDQSKHPPNKKRKIVNKKSNSESIDDENSKSESTDRPLAKLRWFRVILDEAQIMKNYKTKVARACWGLRAKRRWCLSGTPIQNSIDDLYSYFRFLRLDPFSVFKSFCSQIKSPIQHNPDSGYKKLQSILQTIMLRRTKRTFLKGKPIISLPPKTITLTKVEFSDEERGFYRTLEAESRALFAKYTAAGTVKQNYVNILLMLLRLRQACDHPLLVKEFSSSSGKMLSYEKSKSEKLLEDSLAICGICNDPPEDAVVTACEHVFCKQCILEHLSSDDNQCPFSECKKVINKSLFISKSKTIQVYTNIDPAKAIESSKIKAAVQVLKLISQPKGSLGISEKAIVFSQWTRMLDLLEVCLKDSGIGYRRLDGTMSVGCRDKAVTDFNTLPDVSVMIMSLKAASLGLNMVAACHVILLDLWWNPTTEDQAIDRAHRIGQTRPVTVLRFTVKDTVEDRILALQEKKREMVASAFGEDDNGGSQTRLSVEDMRYLFQG